MFLICVKSKWIIDSKTGHLNELLSWIWLLKSHQQSKCIHGPSIFNRLYRCSLLFRGLMVLNWRILKFRRYFRCFGNHLFCGIGCWTSNGQDLVTGTQFVRSGYALMMSPTGIQTPSPWSSVFIWESMLQHKLLRSLKMYFDIHDWTDKPVRVYQWLLV